MVDVLEKTDRNALIEKYQETIKETNEKISKSMDSIITDTNEYINNTKQMYSSIINDPAKELFKEKTSIKKIVEKYVTKNTNKNIYSMNSKESLEETLLSEDRTFNNLLEETNKEIIGNYSIPAIDNLNRH